ncbi:MAG: hypothetical protein QOG10_6503, partial [Kribbellaceae bacterium]|nr:hypothetical protein [Kribbellaceae bacterium]
MTNLTIHGAPVIHRQATAYVRPLPGGPVRGSPD